MENRRQGLRYPLQLTGRYQYGTEEGSCLTIDLSSRGVLLELKQPLDLTNNRKRIEVFLPWPAALENGVRLQIEIRGSVVRVEGNQAALRILSYEFRTLRQQPEKALHLVRPLTTAKEIA